MAVQTAELISLTLASGKTIQQLEQEYNDRDKLDERLKQMTARELLLRDRAYFEMKWYEFNLCFVIFPLLFILSH